MPCDAIARVTGVISEEAFIRVLETEAGVAALEKALPPLLEKVFGQSFTGERYWGRGLSLASSDWGVIVDVYGIEKGIEVRVNSWAKATPQLREQAAAYREQVQAVIQQLAGAILQHQVRGVVARRYAITEQQAAPNGSLVLTVNL